MSDLLRTLAAYVPPRIVRATLEETRPTLPARSRVECYPAAVLFADISGFTPLTEALAQKGSEGPEELTRLLNGYFERMIAIIETEGGEVVKFSGDALTGVFSAQQENLSIATRRAQQAAEAMQAAMGEFSTMETSAGLVTLGMKIGIGAGEILAIRVGGVSDRWEYVIAGDPLRQVAHAEHQADRGEIVLSPQARAIAVPHPVAPCPLPPLDWTQVANPAAVEAALRVYVPGVVTAWLGEALQAWLAVLRPMSVLFASVAGIDYQDMAQAGAADQLQSFMGAAQEIIGRYQGSINKLAVDDKGTILLALFGAPPHAHQDDPERALRCAMDLQGMAAAQGLQLAIGVTTGRVFAGPVGSKTRHEYTVMGDTVNLAARLMSVAGLGQIRCDYETYRSAHSQLAFDLLPPTRVKGKAGLIRLYRPTGREQVDRERAAARAVENGGTLVGRQAELIRLASCLDEIQAGRSRILIIEGEAGIGKSRLIDELTRLMRERGIAGLLGRGRSIEQQTPYRAWRDVFSSYFDLDQAVDLAGADVDVLAERRRRVEAHVKDVTADLAERIPLLNDVLNLGFPENALTSSLDTHVRHQSLVSLLLALLRAWAAERPLVLVLEDAHWLDSMSWDLTLQVARALAAVRVALLLVVVTRPLESETIRLEPQALAGMEGIEQMILDTLSPDETVALAAVRLNVPSDGLPKKVADLVRTRASGNPFFAEELVYALRDNGLIAIHTEAGKTRCIVSGDLEQAAETLPDTIQGIVLSRIDRLSPEEQLTLKVAAVIGRTFFYSALRDTLGEHMEVSDRLLATYLADLTRLDLTPLEAPEPELTYIFKHIITQEVAYETLLFAQRRQLHRTVALWYEHGFSSVAEKEPASSPPRTPSAVEAQDSPLAPYYPLLVYHWHQAQDRERERHYAGLAGRWAAAQFANTEAAGYLSRALELTPQDDLAARYDLLLAREAVNDLLGERSAQAQDLVTLILMTQAADQDSQSTAGQKAHVVLQLANYMEVTSDYSAALIAVHRAIELAEQSEELADDIQSYIAWGRVLGRQGNYEAARVPLARALAMARESGDRRGEAESLRRLGLAYHFLGDYPTAQDHYRQALQIYRIDGNRQGEANSLSDLGMVYGELGDFTAARDYFEQTLRIHQTTGDRLGEIVTLNNLGVIYCDLGDYETARDYHQSALEIRITIGDRLGEATSLVNLGLVYHCLDDNQVAREHCARALDLMQEIGSRRGEGYSLTYLGHVLEGLNKLDAAFLAYDRALRLRRKLGQHGLAIDDLAGLARIALAQGKYTQALAQVDEILDWIEANGTEGIEYPLQVYLACYRVLRATKEDAGLEERADSVLSRAHTMLLEQASGINDETLRLTFLENVKTNREILAIWQAHKERTR